MPVPVSRIDILGRLLDEALAKAPDERDAWIDALPAQDKDLADALRRALRADRDRFLSSGLPRLADDPDDGPAEPRPGQRIGPYRLIEEIGRGGMGTVWRAERADGLYEREVALKVPRLTRGAGLAERMARERRIGARLEHPGIARLYDAGLDDDGRPYIVMERIVGTDILAYCREHRATQAQRIELILQACAAVAHAHAQLVVHRDLKPSNLMVDTSGRLKLLDFGIALLVAESDARSGDASAQRTHTPGYAAPEQLRGEPVTATTDVHALGLLLHELLVGALPVRLPGGGLRLDETLPIDLRAVIAQALRPVPTERYTSIDRLADDLHRILARRPVLARASPWWHHARLFGQRHATALALGVGAGAVTASGAAALVHQRHLELQQTERARQTQVFMFDLLEDLLPDADDVEARSANLPRMRAALDRARRSFPGQPSLQGQVLSELGTLLRVQAHPKLAEHALREANILLEGAAASDDPALAIARAQLALTLDSDDAPESVALARRALADCQEGDARCAKARAYAHAALRLQAQNRGDRAEALAQATMEVRDNERAFGPTNAETAMALSALVMLQRNQGDLVAAQATMARMRDIAQHASLRPEEARAVAFDDAVLQGDLGNHAAARDRLAELLVQPSPIGMHATQARLLSQALFGLGLLEPARVAAETALSESRQAQDDWEAAFDLQARARANAALARFDQARRDIAAAQEGLQRNQFGERSPELLRARRIAGEIELRAGDDAAARALLEPLIVAHRPASPTAVIAPADLAQVFDLLGQIDRRGGDTSAALARHAEAAALLATLPDNHPLRARNALLSALARPSSDAEFARLMQGFLAPLPEASAWRRIPAGRKSEPAAWGLIVL
jgi:serine/threonine-protein kinase